MLNLFPHFLAIIFLALFSLNTQAVTLDPIEQPNKIYIAKKNAWNLDEWDEKSFLGHSSYNIVEENDINNHQRKVLKSSSNQAASGIFKKQKIDINATPYLSWEWKVDNVHEITDQRVKTGDDFPARIYVVVNYGRFPWQTLALNYVWSNIPVNELPNNEIAWPNPFTSKAMMIAVDGGKAGLGEWREYTVNVKEDIKKYFDKDIDTISAIAVMNDSDNHKGKAVSFFGEIFFKTDNQ